jgi:hypothetical protein
MSLLNPLIDFLNLSVHPVDLIYKHTAYNTQRYICLFILFKQAKCCALEVADSEHTLNVYQKKLAGEKQHITALLDKVHKAKKQLLELQHDTEVKYFQHTQFVN